MTNEPDLETFTRVQSLRAIADVNFPNSAPPALRSVATMLHKAIKRDMDDSIPKLEIWKRHGKKIEMLADIYVSDDKDKEEEPKEDGHSMQ